MAAGAFLVQLFRVFVWYDFDLNSNQPTWAMGHSSSSATFPGEAMAVPLWDCAQVCSNESEGAPPRPEGRHKERARDRKTEGRRVLLVGKLRELALYRAEVLRMYGFRVNTPATPAAAMEVIRRREFDIVVLSYTLSSDVVEELAEQVRQYCPSCPLIAISDTRCFDTRILPDQTVFADDGPAALIAAVRHVCRDVN